MNSTGEKNTVKEPGVLSKIWNFLSLLTGLAGLVVIGMACYNWINFGFEEWHIGIIFGLLILGASILLKIEERIRWRLKIKCNNIPTNILNTFEKLKQTDRKLFRKQKNAAVFTAVIMNILTIGNVAFYLGLMFYIGNWAMNNIEGDEDLFVGIGMMILLACAFISGYTFWDKKGNILNSYIKMYKETVFPKILECIDSSLKLYPESDMKCEGYAYSKIDDDLSFSNIHVKDKFIGYNDKIIICNVEVTYVSPRPDGEGERYETGFVGGFIIFDTNKQFDDYVKIKMSRRRPKDLKRININHAEFNEYFKVYSTSDDSARKIVNAQLLKILLDFYKTYNIKFDIVFKEGKIYIKLWVGDVFKINIFEKIFKLKKFAQYYTYINAIKELCLTLDDNIR